MSCRSDTIKIQSSLWYYQEDEDYDEILIICDSINERFHQIFDGTVHASVSFAKDKKIKNKVVTEYNTPIFFCSDTNFIFVSERNDSFEYKLIYNSNHYDNFPYNEDSFYIRKSTFYSDSFEVEIIRNYYPFIKK